MEERSSPEFECGQPSWNREQLDGYQNEDSSSRSHSDYAKIIRKSAPT